MYKLVHLMLLGYSMSLVLGQEPDITEIRQAIASAQHSSEGSEEAQEDENVSALTRLQNVTSMDDFIALLIKDGHPVQTEDIISNYTDQSGTIFINSGGGRMALPDDCSPRDTTVRLTFDNADPNLVYFPRCTKIERCGGCCASPHLECVPSYTERVSYKVIKAEVAYPGSSHLEWKGDFASVILDRHVHCRVQCTLTPDKCGPKKEFLERQCECRCRNYDRCQPPRVWDPEECECKCAEVVTCCKSGETCGLTFVKETCECGVDTNVVHIRNTGNHSQSHSESQNDTLINSVATTTSGTSLPSTDTTATTTTTTASTITTENDPCATIACPIGFSRIMEGENCSCRRRILGRPRSRNTFLP